MSRATKPSGRELFDLEERPCRTFGNQIRAARLGYHWFEPLRMFIRMSDAGPGRTLIEARNANLLPSSGKGEHRRWWDGDDDLVRDLLYLVPALRELMTNGHASAWLLVDDDGQLAEDS